MGIIKKELSKFSLESGYEFIIELNEGDEIHIEIDEKFQMRMSKEEFKSFTQMIKEGHQELENLKK